MYVACDYFQQISTIEMTYPRAYLRGGFRGFKPPPPKFSEFFLKSEGKEIERKRKKKGCWGGGLPLNIFFQVG